MKRLYFLIMCLFVNNVIAQKSNSEKKNYSNNWELSNTFSFETNAFIPLNNLSHTLNNSIGLGFYFGVPIDDNFRIDLGTSIFFPKPKQSIKYFTDDTVLEGGAQLSGVLGLWVTKVKRLGKNWYWDTKSGIGLGFFQTDIETGKPKEENDSVYGAETIFLSLGTAFRTNLFKRNIGVRFEYFFVPYNLFKKRLPSAFGMQYITFGLTYGFK